MTRFAILRRRAKVAALLEVLDYATTDMVMPPTVADIEAWGAPVWSRLTDAANGLLDDGETPFKVPSATTIALIIAELRGRASSQTAVDRYTERVSEPRSKGLWA